MSNKKLPNEIIYRQLKAASTETLSVCADGCEKCQIKDWTGSPERFERCPVWRFRQLVSEITDGIAESFYTLRRD